MEDFLRFDFRSVEGGKEQQQYKWKDPKLALMIRHNMEFSPIRRKQKLFTYSIIFPNIQGEIK